MSNFVTVADGARIFYKDWGNGQPIVFAHGWPLSSDAWDPQMLFMGQNGYRVIAHDRRSHGRSSQTWDGNNMDTYADDLATLMAQAGTGRQTSTASSRRRTWMSIHSVDEAVAADMDDLSGRVVDHDRAPWLGMNITRGGSVCLSADGFVPETALHRFSDLRHRPAASGHLARQLLGRLDHQLR